MFKGKKISYFMLVTSLFFGLSNGYSQSFSNNRGPANFLPSESVRPTLYSQPGIYHYLTLEDDKGVLVEMRNQMNAWNEEEEYLKQWNLEGFADRNIVTTEEKKKYINRYIIKYLDKRLSGEIKRAEEGSVFHRVGQMEQALKPNATVNVSETFKLKIKAKVLEAEASMILDNPYFELESHFLLDGTITVNANKNFDNLGLRFYTNVAVNSFSYSTSIEKTLPYNVLAKLSSDQSLNEVAFTGDTNKTLSFNYNFVF